MSKLKDFLEENYFLITLLIISICIVLFLEFIKFVFDNI